MKKLYKGIILFLSLTILLSCNSFLEQDPIGDTIGKKQYNQLDNTLEGTMRGVYSMMYESGGSGHHDIFGQRSIDMYGDLLCGDMALKSDTYGWFSTDERQGTSTARSSYIWSYNYNMLRNINMVIDHVKTKTELLQHVEKYGFPAEGMKVYNEAHDSVIYHYGEKDSLAAIYYAQALAMRGYVYSNLLRFYTPTLDQLFERGYTQALYKTIPIYTEDHLNDNAHDLSTLEEVCNQCDSDFTKSIKYFDAFAKDFEPSSKIMVNINVARGLAAYFNLNTTSEKDDTHKELRTKKMRKALTYATQVINSGEYSIIPNGQVLTNGFNHTSDNSWMWGQHVTVETASGLASFFGQVDIHTYSYAWAGDGKVIDKELYESIPSWDIRKRWFNDGKEKASYELCPDKKFFSAASPTSTKADDIDREWLSDNVFMRIESMYLIAAEACYFLDKQDSAIMFLTAITDQRVDTGANAATEYATFKASLADKEILINALIQNWRVEMWGEGYGLQTFRRLTSHAYKCYDEAIGDYVYKIRRGSNHIYNKGAEMIYDKDSESTYTLQIPASETNYNNYLRK